MGDKREQWQDCVWPKAGRLGVDVTEVGGLVRDVIKAWVTRAGAFLDPACST